MLKHVVFLMDILLEHIFITFYILTGHSCTHSCCYCNIATCGDLAYSQEIENETRTIGTLKRDFNNFIDPKKGNSKKSEAKNYNNVVDLPLLNAENEKKHITYFRPYPKHGVLSK